MDRAATSRAQNRWLRDELGRLSCKIDRRAFWQARDHQLGKCTAHLWTCNYPTRKRKKRWITIYKRRALQWWALQQLSDCNRKIGRTWTKTLVSVLGLLFKLHDHESDQVFTVSFHGLSSAWAWMLALLCSLFSDKCTAHAESVDFARLKFWAYTFLPVITLMR